MPFPPAFIDEVIARNPIEDVVGQYVTLKRSGSNLFGLCPFHGEKTPSFSVAPDKGMFYCFGCHKGGGVINFEMEIEGLSYGDAVRALAKRAGLDVPEDEQYQSRYRQQERLWALHKEAARFLHSCLYAPMGASALEYARGRGMSQATLTKFGIGYAPDSWDDLVNAMRKKGYTDQELRDSGLVTVSKKNGNLFDRFPGSADVSYHRRPGKRHRLRRAHYERPGQKRRKILKFPGNPDFQQAKEPVCPELRQEKQNGLPDSGGGVYGRHRPASVWI